MKALPLLIIATLAILFQSCTITQRRYITGFYVEKNSNYKISLPQAESRTKQHLNNLPLNNIQPTVQENKFITVAAGQISNKKQNFATKAQVKISKIISILPIASIIKRETTHTNISESVTEFHHSDAGEGTNGFAIACLVCGILSLCTFYAGIVFGVIAIILGGVAFRQIENNGGGGKTLAIIGEVLGIIGFLVWLMVLISASGALLG
jgi:hypothetical protein